MLRRAFPRVYEGWIVVGASAFVILLIGATFYYGFGTIFNEVIEEFGWSVAATSLAFSLRSEVGGLAAPLVGVALDRVGAQRVIVTGILVSVAGVVLLSLVQELWQFYGAMIVIAIGATATGGQVGLAAVATWFEARRAWAMAIMTIGGGLGGLVVVAVAWLVDALGWRAALQVLAAIMLVAGVAMAVNVRSRPARHHQPIDGAAVLEGGGFEEDLPLWGVPVMRAMRTRAFVMMSIGMIGLSFATTALVVHQIPFLEREMGVSKAVAGSSVAAYTLVSIVGRLGLGYYADRYSKRLMLAASAAMIAAGLLVVALADTFLVAIIGIMIVAPGFGGFIPVRPALFADYFGTRYFGTLNGVAMLVNTVGGVLGPWIVGWLVDRTGGYTEGWLVAAVAALAAIPFFLVCTPPLTLMAQYADGAADPASRASRGRVPPDLEA